MTRLRYMVIATVLAAVAAVAASRIERGSGAASPRRIGLAQPPSSPFVVPAPAVATVSPLAPRPLGGSYRILLNRSLFAGRQETARPLNERASLPPPSLESHLVFLGAMRVGSRPLASIEDTEAARQLWVAPGGELPGGIRVREVELDYLIVEKNGSSRRIDLGSNLEGTPAAVADSGGIPSAAGLPTLAPDADEPGPEGPDEK